MAPHTPGVLRFGKLSKKPVAPAGYKNKQCRKQTSVLSGRIVTAYVPLRSATERERAAFLIPCQGLRDYFTNSQVTLQNEIRSATLMIDFLFSFVVSPRTFWHRLPGPHRPWNEACYGSVRNIPWLQ